ncbi:cupin domain-containing protein [Paraglaciecola sp. L1A13]|uniref:cupin domain-containing protein n=1 Tax=Paraglaciecola sp. L1A13 TaxID=2686359 RepID=UPI00351A72C9|tara:strand:+ start:666 stop:1298 length:633 start_codon:yes stop_codon:yes gene_type:complete
MNDMQNHTFFKTWSKFKIYNPLMLLGLITSVAFTSTHIEANQEVPALTKEQVISQLNLSHHFEGGYFRQTFKAQHRDKVATSRGDRTTMTAIFYMLTDDNNVDHFHTKYSDGIEFYHMGSPITYHMIYPDGRYEKVVVGPDIQNGQQLQLAVPGGTYKAAELTTGTYGLVSESVAPGWEAEDMVDVSRDELLIQFPQHRDIIERLANKKP